MSNKALYRSRRPFYRCENLLSAFLTTFVYIWSFVWHQVPAVARTRTFSVLPLFTSILLGSGDFLHRNTRLRAKGENAVNGIVKGLINVLARGE